MAYILHFRHTRRLTQVCTGKRQNQFWFKTGHSPLISKLVQQLNTQIHLHVSLVNCHSVIQTHRRFKRTLSYYDIDNTMQKKFWEIPFFRPENDTQTTVKWLKTMKNDMRGEVTYLFLLLCSVLAGRMSQMWISISWILSQFNKSQYEIKRMLNEIDIALTRTVNHIKVCRCAPGNKITLENQSIGLGYRVPLARAEARFHQSGWPRLENTVVLFLFFLYHFFLFSLPPPPPPPPRPCSVQTGH